MTRTSDVQREHWRTVESAIAEHGRGCTYVNDGDGLGPVSKMNRREGGQITYVFEVDKGISNAVLISNNVKAWDWFCKHTCSCWRSLKRISINA